MTPKGSPLAGGKREEYIEGLVEYYIPPLIDKNIIDHIKEVSARDAIEYMIKITEKEGILGGVSTGAHVYVALTLAKELGSDKVVVTIAADSIFRYIHYLSSKVRV